MSVSPLKNQHPHPYRYVGGTLWIKLKKRPITTLGYVITKRKTTPQVFKSGYIYQHIDKTSTTTQASIQQSP